MKWIRTLFAVIGLVCIHFHIVRIVVVPSTTTSLNVTQNDGFSLKLSVKVLRRIIPVLGSVIENGFDRDKAGASLESSAAAIGKCELI